MSHPKDCIVIEAYDPQWPQMAEMEMLCIKKALPFSVGLKRMEHVGSTAIPGLWAKPIIDIYIGVTSIVRAQEAIRPLERMGYAYWKENPNKKKMFFVKGMPPFGEKRTHHVHIVEEGSDYEEARILFRDYLRLHSKEREAYGSLKKEFAKLYKYDREAYTEAKGQFIEEILKKAGFDKKVRR
jgi:GrpB-like predicted nucleotidyltransferase (UPF0157 family)